MTSLSQVNEMLLLRFAFLMLVAFGGTCAMAETDSASDYPTQARAEYVFACMASNGQTQEALRQCSCSIDVIASILPYDKYEQAETVLRMRRSGGGYLGEMFRAATASNMVRDLEEAQAEGEIRCF
jgi:hypothetical protein